MAIKNLGQKTFQFRKENLERKTVSCNKVGKNLLNLKVTKEETWRFR